MPSTSQTRVPHLLSSETNLSQEAVYSDISELMTPTHSRSRNESQAAEKPKQIKKQKKLEKSKFKVEDVETSDKANDSSIFSSEMYPLHVHVGSAFECIDPRANFYELDDTKVLLTIQQSCSIYFCGILTVSVLSGGVEILGFLVEPNGREYTAFSLNGSSLLCLSSMNNVAYKTPTLMDLITLGMSKSVASKVLCDCTHDTSFVVLKRGMTQALSTIFMYFVERYCKYSLFNDVIAKGQQLLFAEKVLRCTLYKHTGNTLRKEYTIIPEWIKIKEDLLKFSECKFYLLI